MSDFDIFRRLASASSVYKLRRKSDGQRFHAHIVRHVCQRCKTSLSFTARPVRASTRPMHRHHLRAVLRLRCRPRSAWSASPGRRRARRLRRWSAGCRNRGARAFAPSAIRHSGETIDQALVLFFEGPNSETGEDVAELQLHGGRAVIAATFAALVADARIAAGGGGRIHPARLRERQARSDRDRGPGRPDLCRHRGAAPPGDAATCRGCSATVPRTGG